VAQEHQPRERFWAPAATDPEAQGLTNVKLACAEGSPARGITGSATKNGLELLAVAPHGKGLVAWVLSGAAEKVMEIKPLLLKEGPILIWGLPEASPCPVGTVQVTKSIARAIGLYLSCGGF
jgi:hypothetical protein